MSIPDYYEWKNMPFEEQDATNMESLKTNWHERVLFVQGESSGVFYFSLCFTLVSIGHNAEKGRWQRRHESWSLRALYCMGIP
jgi:hypothetical protein